MAKPHFAIEPPRKIHICIEGYDPQARTQAQRRKQQERRQRLARRAARTTPQAPAAALGCTAPDAGDPPATEAIAPDAAAAETPARAPEPASELQQQLLDTLS